MAGTATTKTKPATPAAQRPVVFESEATELALLIKPGFHTVTDYGRVETRPVFAQFSPQRNEHGEWAGRFVVMEDDHCRRMFDMTRDQLLDRMRTHGANRDNPHRESMDFWELHPSSYAPDATPLLVRIAKLAARGDADGLVGLLDEEEQGSQRPVVLEALRGALDPSED